MTDFMYSITFMMNYIMSYVSAFLKGNLGITKDSEVGFYEINYFGEIIVANMKTVFGINIPTGPYITEDGCEFSTFKKAKLNVLNINIEKPVALIGLTEFSGICELSDKERTTINENLQKISELVLGSDLNVDLYAIRTDNNFEFNPYKGTVLLFKDQDWARKFMYDLKKEMQLTMYDRVPRRYYPKLVTLNRSEQFKLVADYCWRYGVNNQGTGTKYIAKYQDKL